MAAEEDSSKVKVTTLLEFQGRVSLTTKASSRNGFQIVDLETKLFLDRKLISDQLELYRCILIVS